MSGTGPANPWDLGFDIGIALLLGVIFLFMGMRFGQWSMTRIAGKPFDTTYTWGAAGAAAGKAWDAPVEYFDLLSGDAWGEMGFFVVGAALLLEAAILAIAMWRRRAGTGVFGTCMVLGIIGAVANIVAIVMLVRAGITMPLISIIAMFVGGFAAYMHARHLFERTN